MSETQPITMFVAYKIGDLVYLKIDPEELGMVIGYDVRPDYIQYCISWPGGCSTYHYEMELTDQENFVFE